MSRGTKLANAHRVMSPLVGEASGARGGGMGVCKSIARQRGHKLGEHVHRKTQRN
jgi:hypothetical protein